MSTIKFIYFDVGGVAILDFSKTNKWNELLDDLGITVTQKPQFDKLFDEHEGNICCGEDMDVFVKEAETKLGIQFPKDYDMAQDFVNRFEPNPAILELIKELKPNYELGLLTNQYPNLLNLIFQKGLLPQDIWDVIIDSSVVRMAKPDPRIYDLAEEKSSTKPTSILFVDNKARLLEYPKSKGWDVFEYDPSNTPQSTRKLMEYIHSKDT